MDEFDNRYTEQIDINGVSVIEFLDRGPDHCPESTYTNDIAEFEQRMAPLGTEEHPVFVVLDFTNYGMTSQDNGRAIVGLVIAAQKRLKATGGGLLVCNHPAQFNPEWQHLIHFDRFIEIHASRGDAIDAARSQIRNTEESDSRVSRHQH